VYVTRPLTNVKTKQCKGISQGSVTRRLRCGGSLTITSSHTNDSDGEKNFENRSVIDDITSKRSIVVRL